MQQLLLLLCSVCGLLNICCFFFPFRIFFFSPTSVYIALYVLVISVLELVAVTARAIRFPFFCK